MSPVLPTPFTEHAFSEILPSTWKVENAHISPLQVENDIGFQQRLSKVQCSTYTSFIERCSVLGLSWPLIFRQKLYLKVSTQMTFFLFFAVDFYFGRISFEWLSEKSFGRKNFQRFYFVCGQNINLAFWNKENITQKIIEEDITLSLARDQRASYKNVGFMGEHRNWGKSSIYHLMPSWARNHQCSTSGTLSAF